MLITAVATTSKSFGESNYCSHFELIASCLFVYRCMTVEVKYKSSSFGANVRELFIAAFYYKNSFQQLFDIISFLPNDKL